MFDGTIGASPEKEHPEASSAKTALSRGGASRRRRSPPSTVPRLAKLYRLSRENPKEAIGRDRVLITLGTTDCTMLK